MLKCCCKICPVCTTSGPARAGLLRRSLSWWAEATLLRVGERLHFSVLAVQQPGQRLLRPTPASAGVSRSSFQLLHRAAPRRTHSWPCFSGLLPPPSGVAA